MTGRRLIDSECEMEVETARLPLPHELLWPLEAAALSVSPVFAGAGVPHGQGEPVLVVPGFLGAYADLGMLTGWLGRVGYDVRDPGFGRNMRCPDVLLQLLERRIDAVSAATHQRVRLIGHSLGGSLARAAAVRRADRVAHVVTLASPLRSMTAHPVIVEIARLLARIVPSRHAAHEGHVHGPTCACELAEALGRPWPREVGRTAIYTRGDGVVDWRACVDDEAGANREVRGTHVGIVVNAGAYTVIAHALNIDAPSGAAVRQGGTV